MFRVGDKVYEQVLRGGDCDFFEYEVVGILGDMLRVRDCATGRVSDMRASNLMSRERFNQLAPAYGIKPR